MSKSKSLKSENNRSRKQSNIKDPTELNDQTKSVTFIEDDTDEQILNKEINAKNIFLSKVGLTFIFYYLLSFLVCLFAFKQNNLAKKFCTLTICSKTTWIYILCSVILKIVFSMKGKHIRKYSTIFFLLDCKFTMLATIGIFMQYDNVLADNNISPGYYVLLITGSLLACSVGFTISTLIKDRKYIYNYWLGMLISNFLVFISLSIFFYFINMKIIIINKLLALLVYFALYCAYLTLDMHQVVKIRANKFYDTEYFYCFFCFWTDIYYKFWNGFLDKDAIFRESKFIKNTSSVESELRVA